MDKISIIHLAKDNIHGKDAKTLKIFLIINLMTAFRKICGLAT